MPAKKGRDRTGERIEGQDTAQADCPLCVKNETTNTRDGSLKRQGHYFQVARTDGLDGLKAHLTLYLHRWHADAETAQEKIHSTMAYVGQEVAAFSGDNALANPDTGRKLPWWEGRVQYRAAMQAGYARIEEEAKEKERVNNQKPRDVPGFSRVTAPVYLREPDASEYIQEPGEGDDAAAD